MLWPLSVVLVANELQKNTNGRLAIPALAELLVKFVRAYQWERVLQRQTAPADVSRVRTWCKINVRKMLIVKNQTVIDCLQLSDISDTKTRDNEK